MIGSKAVKQLLQQMTLVEKAAEMTQLWGENPDGTLMGILRGFHDDEQLAANAGSLLGFNGAKRVIEAQRIHMEENAHHIPLLFMTDVIHGYKTIFPSVLGLGATWNPDLVKRTAAIAAKEAAVSGVHVTFSPMVDLVRDARWGRVIESTGEDSYLNSLYAKAFIEGYQGDNLSEPFHIAACVKHFLGYGAVEGGRDYDGVQLGDYELYNQYLPAFEAAIKAGCEMLMPSFNTINGIPCTSNSRLLRDILRKELSFNGTIISDCTAVCELVAHGVCEDNGQAASMALNAGVDIEMVSSTFYEHIKELVDNHTVSIEQIDASVERILLLKDKLGLFENPYKDASPDAEKKWHLCKEHRQCARDAVSQSLVLLKNECEALPLKNTEKIALIGPFAESQQFVDIWGKVNGSDEDCIRLIEGLVNYQVKTAHGCHLQNTRTMQKMPSDDTLIQEAITLALQSDKVVLTLGEHPDMSAEAGSRTEITLPSNQLMLLNALVKTGKPIVSIIFCGRPLVLEEVVRHSYSVLIAWFPGTEAGNGIADVLSGITSPTGRLPMSFPRSTGQCPIYYNHLPTGRPNTTSKYAPFTNGYIGIQPGSLFPFGFGLTYTTFTYSHLTLSQKTVTVSLESQVLLTASVTIQNTGHRIGTEVVQLYIQDLAGSYSRPIKELKGFKQVTLQPGEFRKVNFPIHTGLLKYYIPGKGLTLESGKFKVFIGSHADCASYQEFTLLS